MKKLPRIILTALPALLAALTLQGCGSGSSSPSNAATPATPPTTGTTTPTVPTVPSIAAGVSVIAGGAPFINPAALAATPDGTIYVLDIHTAAVPTSSTGGIPPQYALRKITPAGQVSTLAASLTLSASSGTASVASSIFADKAGNVYVIESPYQFSGSSLLVGGAVYKLGADGVPALLAGQAPFIYSGGSYALADGTGANAHFNFPVFAGFDADNNIYLSDGAPSQSANAPVYRKMTPQGVVTTIAALPSGITVVPGDAGISYTADTVQQVVLRTQTDGSSAVIAGVRNQPGDQVGDLPGLLTFPKSLVKLNASTYALISAQRVLKLVVPSATTAVPESISVSAPVVQTTAGGKSVPLSAATGSGAVPAWTLAAGAPGSLSASSGANINYVPPTSIATPSTVTITASSGKASKTVTLTIYPPAPVPGISLIAEANFITAIAPTPDGSLYLLEQLNGSALPSAYGIRKISPEGVVASAATPIPLSSFAYVINDLVADKTGTVYFVVTPFVPPRALDRIGGAIFKLDNNGQAVLVAGEMPRERLWFETYTLNDGIGAEARFNFPKFAGFDADNNMYIVDRSRIGIRPGDQPVYRKMTPLGAVTTLTALPAGRNLALDGNPDTYSADGAQSVVFRTTPDGTRTVIAGVLNQPGNQLGQLPGLLTYPSALTQISPYTYALYDNNRVLRLVVPH